MTPDSHKQKDGHTYDRAVTVSWHLTVVEKSTNSSRHCIDRDFIQRFNSDLTALITCQRQHLTYIQTSCEPAIDIHIVGISLRGLDFA